MERFEQMALFGASEGQTPGDDFTPEPNAKGPHVKRGELWRLGRHMLLCGDATNPNDVRKVTEGRPMDLVFTDPPYGMSKERQGVTGDNQHGEQLLTFNKKWIPLTFDALGPAGSWYCWGNDEVLFDIYSEIIKPAKRRPGANRINYRGMVVWNKMAPFGVNSPEMRTYPAATEKALFCMKGRQDFGQVKADYFEGFEPIRQYMEDQRKKTGVTTDELCKIAGATTIAHWWARSQWEFPNRNRYETLQRNLRARGLPGFEKSYDELLGIQLGFADSFQEAKAKVYGSRAYFDNTHGLTDVWNIPNPSSGKERATAGGHPTIKPLRVCMNAITSSCPPGGYVLDVFGGSGSTLIACETLGRSCRMIEIEPKWCRVIIQRYEKTFGKKAERVSE